MHDFSLFPDHAQPQAGPRSRGVLELLWHQRKVELSGKLHRICVPLIGADVPSDLAAELTALLEAWWTDRGALSPTVGVTSVIADVQGDASTGLELVLLVTTDGLALDHSIVSVRMIRDLRRALRIARLHTPAHAAPLAA